MRIACFAALIIVGACSFPAPLPPRPATSPPVTVEPASALAEDMVRQTNAERRALGLAEHRRSAALMQAAQLHAEQMARTQTMAHDIPGTTYPTLRTRMDAVGYPWRAMAENVAQGYTDARSVVSGWMKSTGHRANIVSTQFQELGTGTAVASNGQRFWVQVFGTPR